MLHPAEGELHNSMYCEEDAWEEVVTVLPQIRNKPSPGAITGNLWNGLADESGKVWQRPGNSRLASSPRTNSIRFQSFDCEDKT